MQQRSGVVAGLAPVGVVGVVVPRDGLKSPSVPLLTQ